MQTKCAIKPPRISKGFTVSQLIDETFLAYNAARLRETAQLLAGRVLKENATVGLSLSGAMTPAGVGMSSMVPLIENGLVDYVITTGANIYHDLHHGLDKELIAGSPFADDIVLNRDDIVRIYDVFVHCSVLRKTDEFIYGLIDSPRFQKEMGTAEFHYLLGEAVTERADTMGLTDRTLVGTAYRCGVPLYVSSPGDSCIGMNIAARRLHGTGPRIDPSLDVNEAAAIVLEAKRNGRKSAAWMIGGGSPKNFLLQTIPHLHGVVEDVDAHDYFVQITDARPDTGGLSGATPGEALTWGKVSQDGLSDMVVCYLDSTVALPLLTAYLLERCEPRPLKRLYNRRGEMLEVLSNSAVQAYQKSH